VPGRADAVSYSSAKPRTVFDWKSDVAPDNAARAGYASQIGPVDHGQNINGSADRGDIDDLEIGVRWRLKKEELRVLAIASATVSGRVKSATATFTRSASGLS